MRKRGSGSNCFDEDLLVMIYDDYEHCVHCGAAGADCFDHVEPRSGVFTNSILNASPTHNQKCNISQHGEMHQFNNKIRMIKTNMERVFREGYKLQQVDRDFIKTYKSAQIALDQLAKQIL